VDVALLVVLSLKGRGSSCSGVSDAYAAGALAAAWLQRFRRVARIAVAFSPSAFGNIPDGFILPGADKFSPVECRGENQRDPRKRLPPEVWRCRLNSKSLPPEERPVLARTWRSRRHQFYGPALLAARHRSTNSFWERGLR
jgi:hypothetical protein